MKLIVARFARDHVLSFLVGLADTLDKKQVVDNLVCPCIAATIRNYSTSCVMALKDTAGNTVAQCVISPPSLVRTEGTAEERVCHTDVSLET